MDYYDGTRVKREEAKDGGEEGAGGWSGDMAKEFSLEETALKLAAGRGMNYSKAFRAVPSPAGRGSGVTRDINKHGGVHGPVAGPAVKTQKYSGRSDWEAFHTQFELLAHAAGWSMEAKSLKLASCLTDDALSCLVLVSPEDRHNYGVL